MTMPNLNASAIGLTLLAAVAVVILAWFFVGMQMNLVRGNNALRWIKDGLPVLAEKTSLRWLGSSVVQMGMATARAPFKQIDILVMMEPRDVAILWFLTRRQGRRDTLILRGHLLRAARSEFDILDAKSWSGKDALAHLTPDTWQQTAFAGMLLAAENSAAAQAAQQLLPVVQRMGGQVVRFSARRTVPNLEIHVTAPWSGQVSSREAMQAFKEIAEALLPQS
jgi:hypothetical protein